MHDLQIAIGGSAVIGSTEKLLHLLEDLLQHETPAPPIAVAQLLDCLTCSCIRRPSNCELCSFSGQPCRYGDGTTQMPGVQAPPTLGSIALRRICARAPDLETALLRHATDALLTLVNLVQEDFPHQFESMVDVARLATVIAYRLQIPDGMVQLIAVAALLQDLGHVLVLARAEVGHPPNWDIRPGRAGRAGLTERLLVAGGASELMRRVIDPRGEMARSTQPFQLAQAAAIVRMSRDIHDRLHGPTDSFLAPPASLAQALRLAAATDPHPEVLLSGADVVASYSDDASMI